MTEKEWDTLEAGDYVAQKSSPGMVFELTQRDHAGSWIAVMQTGGVKIRSLVIYTLPALWQLRARSRQSLTR